MKTIFKQIEKLIEYENKFIEIIEEKDISILRDIDFTKEEYEEIRYLIEESIRNNKFIMIRKKTPLCVSLFIVWCVIYNYNEGDMWGPVLNAINISINQKNRRALGELFLSTLNKYNLLKVKEPGAKKYLSPILMHGYISNYYSIKLFDRLNKLYEIILERDASYENIEEHWELMFPEDYSKNDQLKKKESLEKKILHLEEELSQISNLGDYIDISKEELEISESELENIYGVIKELEKEKEIVLNELENINDIYKDSTEIIHRTSSLEQVFIGESLEIITYIHDNLEVLINKLDDLKTDYNEENKKINNNIQKLSNEKKIKQRKIIDIKTKVSILGTGNIDNGWDELKNIKNHSELLIIKQNELKKMLKLLQLEAENDNKNFIQIYTASLYYLSISSPSIFKNFIIEILRMMDTYFKTNKIDKDSLLAKEFIDWYNIEIKKPIQVGKKDSNSLDNNENKDIKTRGENRLGRVESIKDPYIQLGNDKYTIELIIPEQSFKISHNINFAPKYILTFKDGTKTIKELSFFKKDNTAIIHEKKIELKKEIVSLGINWLNIRNVFDIDLESITVFEQNGKENKKQMLENGLYYILINKHWRFGEKYISRSNSSIRGFNIIEMPINENEITFTNDLIEEKITLRGSKYNNIKIEELYLVEGVTADDLDIIIGKLPKLTYNNLMIDHEGLSVNILVDGMMFLEKSLEEIAKQDKYSENIYELNLNDIFKRKYKYPIKIDLSLVDANDEKKLNMSYVWVTNTEFKYAESNLIVYYPKKCRLKHSKAVHSRNMATIPLIKSPYEEFQIYYSGYGYKKFKVDVPSIEILIYDNEKNIVEHPCKLIKDETNELKKHKLEVKAIGNGAKAIKISNNNNLLNILISLKKNRAIVELDSIIDFLCADTDNDVLKLKWVGKKSCGQDIEIFNIYKDWVINKIEVYQEEVEDEYILEIKYRENFNYSGEKLISLINEGKLIFSKKLKDDNPFYYIKKDSITSNKIRIEIYRKKQSGIFASRRSKDILIAKKDIDLKSEIIEIERIKKFGIVLDAFTYKRKVYNLKKPLKINSIIEGEPLNFIGEAIYNGVAECSGKDYKIIFYLDIEKKKIPILLDMDRDGAQYDLDTDKVFWELKKGKHILAPIEDFDYKIKE